MTSRPLPDSIRAIEAEFEEPIFSVVQGFADMGYTRMATGRILGYSGNHFTTRLLPRIDPERAIRWPSPSNSPDYRDAIASTSFRENCRKAAEARERRKHLVEINGEFRTKAEWRALYGVSHSTVWRRMNQCGWDFATAVTTPTRQSGRKNTPQASAA